MKKVKFTVSCIATYNAELEVEDNLTDEEILDEIHLKLNTVVPVTELTWVEDLEPESAVNMEDIISIEPVAE